MCINITVLILKKIINFGCINIIYNCSFNNWDLFHVIKVIALIISDMK